MIDIIVATKYDGKKFEITNKIKRQVARDVKRIMSYYDLKEICILYDTKNDLFNVLPISISKVMLNKDGWLIYDYYYNDRIEKTTLKDIERLIFN